MRTVDDLQAAFADLAAQAPSELRDPAAVLASASHHSRRRLVAVLAAAALIIGTVLGLSLSRRHTTEPEPAKPSPSACPVNAHCPVLQDGQPVSVALRYTLSAKHGSDWSVQYRALTTTTEQMVITDVTSPPGLAQSDASVTTYSTAATVPHFIVQEAALVPGHVARWVSFGSEAPDRGIRWRDGDRTVLVTT